MGITSIMDGAGKGPDQVVGRLVLEEERRVVGVRPAAIELERVALAALDVQREVQPAVDHGGKHRVARKQIGDPAEREGLHRLHRRRQVHPHQHG
jgi:hypothetical protein